MMLGCIGLLLVLPARSQTFAEWFRQNSTRLKYYAKQIAALQAYLGQMQKGYQIVDAGLGTITDSKHGEYELHSNYYASFGQVNPVLGQLDELADIAALQVAIVQRFTNALARYRRSGLLGADRLRYIDGVYRTILRAGFADVDVLADVLTAGKWKMTDDQRMERIRKIDEAARGRYSFVLAFTGQADVLERQLDGERSGVGELRALYGVP